MSVVLLMVFSTATGLADDTVTVPDVGLPKTVSILSAAGPVKIVSFGDSVTGVYYHTGGRRAYPNMVELALKQLYPRAEVTAINAGVSGHTTDEAVRRTQKDVLEQQPNVVTMMFGLNDIVRVPIEQFRANLEKIVQQCRSVGAEVLLCTPNSMIKDMPGRPREKLIQYSDVIRELGRELDAPVCDCHQSFQAVRARDPLAWRTMMSDEFHPNMDGHKLIAEEITHSITGIKVKLRDIGPPLPAIPQTLGRLEADAVIRILAMPPYDELIEPALKQVDPSARVEVTAWPTTGQSLAQIEVASKRVRQQDVDLVILAIPRSAYVETPEQFIRSYTSIMNWSLSFSHQEWDVVAIGPTVAADLTRQQRRESARHRERDQLARQLIRAQDLSMIDRQDDDDSSADTILANWFSDQKEHRTSP